MNPNRSGVGPLSVSIRSELSIMRNRVAETVLFVNVPSCFSPYHSHVFPVEKNVPCLLNPWTSLQSILKLCVVLLHGY